VATVAVLDILFNADSGNAMAAFGGLQDQLFRTAIAGQKIGTPIVNAVKGWVTSAIDLETQMNNVNSIAKVSQDQLGAWTDEVQRLAVEWGQGSVDTASGMYQIQSAGFAAADAIEILDSSSMAARAGLSTVAVASDAVTSVLKAYENQLGSTSQAYQALTSNGERAEYVQNVLFRGVDRGKMTYDQLAGAIGNSIATSATAGISIEEMVGSMALMTQQGLSASESSTALNNTLLAFINPADKMTEAVQSMGYESALSMLQTEGLAKSMQLLETYTGGSADQIAELFTNIRSRRGAMLLMNGDLEAMIAMMDDAQGGAGKLSAMQSALEEQTKSTSFALDVIKASFEVMGQELVQSFLPVIRSVAFALSDFAKFVIALRSHDDRSRSRRPVCGALWSDPATARCVDRRNHRGLHSNRCPLRSVLCLWIPGCHSGLLGHGRCP
jgi:TP901 family phage tail tape measure protein